MVLRRVVTWMMALVLLVAAGAAMAEAEAWTCLYDEASNTLNFCTQCGRSREDATTWLCQTCGSRNKATANFCTQCGTARNLTQRQEEEEPDAQTAPFQITAVEEITDGAVITWAGGTEPFAIAVGTRKEDGTLAVVEKAELIMGTGCTLYQMAPGASYGFEVTDVSGLTAGGDFTVPEAASFVDGALMSRSLTMSVEGWRQEADRKVTLSALASAEIALQQDAYGVEVSIHYPQLKYTRNFATLAVVTAPDGYVHVIDCGTLEYPREEGRGVRKITVSLGGFFTGLYEAYGCILPGEYQVTVYLEGMHAAEGTFSIQ